MTDTSLEAFEKILPLIGNRQLLVLEHLSWVDCATDAMICGSLKLPINCTVPRRNELVKKGCVIAIKIGTCPATGGTATFWQITEKGRDVIAFRKNKMEDIFE